MNVFQGKYTEAEPIYERALAIREKVLGSEHPDVAATLNDRAGLLTSQVRAKNDPSIVDYFMYRILSSSKSQRDWILTLCHNISWEVR